MKIVVSKPISLYTMGDERVKMAPVPPGEYDLEVIANPVDRFRGGPWYRLKGTDFGAATSWIEEMGNDPGKTGVTIVGVGEKASSQQQPKKKKKKWF